MRTHLSKEEVANIKPDILNRIIDVAGLRKKYLDDKDNINFSLDISILLLVLDRHIDRSFHIYSMTESSSAWVSDCMAFRSTGKDLLESLLKAVLYAYDETERIREQEEREKIWKESNNVVVNVKNHV